MVVGAVMACTCLLPGVALAQGSPTDPNPGALTVTGGLDAPSVYVFRGIVQERDPKVTLFPYADLGMVLASGEGGLKSVGLNIGLWNSLQTGSSGTAGFTEHLHYEEDFYATLALGVGKGLTFGTTYTAYTSPNFVFDTVTEVSVKVSQSGRFSPYGLVGFELGKHGADGGAKKGTYLEVGVGPGFSLGSKMRLTIPVKLGASLKNYYELNGVDHRFGFLDVGALVTVPLSGASNRFGSWNVHGGVDVFTFGDTTKAFNAGDKNKIVGLVGVGLTY